LLYPSETDKTSFMAIVIPVIVFVSGSNPAVGNGVYNDLLIG